jgi:CheY-like chemotaxis protein
MILQALLVSKDDQAAETLTQVLAQFGVAVDRSSAAEVAVARISEAQFDEVIVDFEDPITSTLVLEAIRKHAAEHHSNPPVTVALVADPMQIRNILGAGAHFIVNKPIHPDQASATLRAATALLKRERRRSFRVPVQAPVTMRTDEAADLEGIMLDLSTGGIDVLAAKPISSSSLVHFCFVLPDSGATIEGDAAVAWGSPNGQTGLRFLDMPAELRQQLSDWLTAHSQEALPEEPDPVSRCKLTDLSLGGCYVETESPFPQISAVDLCLKAAGMEIHTEGVVRVMHPSFGMGIEFPSRTEEQRRSVGEFIEFLTSQPGTSPQLEISPRGLVAGADEVNPSDQESEDALLALLRGGEKLEQNDFLSQLHQQRSNA